MRVAVGYLRLEGCQKGSWATLSDVYDFFVNYCVYTFDNY